MVQLAALALDNPNIADRVAKGVGQGQTMVNNDFEMRKKQVAQASEAIAAAAMYAKGGDPAAAADPAKFDEALSGLQQMGIPVEQYKGKPEVADAALAYSIGAINAVKLAQNEADLERRMKQAEAEAQMKAKEFALRERRLTMQEQNSSRVTPSTSVGKVLSDLNNGIITQEQANALIAKETAGKSGITVSPDGTVTIGGTPSGQPFGKAATNEIQKGIVADEMLLSQTEALGNLYDPSILTYQNQIKGAATAIGEKAGIEPSPEAKEALQKRTKFINGVERLFNAYRKEITGAAAAVQELERLKKSFINADMSPSEFEAAFNEYQSELKRSLRLRRRLLREGVDPKTESGGDKFDTLYLGGADDDANQRGNELMQELGDENAVLEQLRKEGFGQ